MSREEFMAALKRLLADIPAESGKKRCSIMKIILTMRAERMRQK